jgi:hypothetical protein
MSSAPASPEADSVTPVARNEFLEIVSAGSAAALFFSAFLVLPIAGPIALPFAAVPIVRTAHRRGAIRGMLTAGFATLLLFLLVWATGSLREGLGFAVFAGAWSLLPALGVGVVRHGADPSRVYLGVCTLGLVVAGALLMASPQADATMGREIDRGFDEWRRLSTQAGKSPTDLETATRIQSTLEAARLFCKRYWFGLIGVSWILASAISFYVGAWSARPAASAVATRFESLRIPSLIAALFVAVGAGWALAAPALARVSGNLLWPLAALYFVAGLSIICHFARRWFRSRLLRVGLYALVIYVPINVGVMLLGLFDWYVNFRHRGRETRES